MIQTKVIGYILAILLILFGLVAALMLLGAPNYLTTGPAWVLMSFIK